MIDDLDSDLPQDAAPLDFRTVGSPPPTETGEREGFPYDEFDDFDDDFDDDFAEEAEDEYNFEEFLDDDLAEDGAIPVAAFMADLDDAEEAGDDAEEPVKASDESPAPACAEAVESSDDVSNDDAGLDDDDDDDDDDDEFDDFEDEE